jgi:hypothetical protein
MIIVFAEDRLCGQKGHGKICSDFRPRDKKHSELGMSPLEKTAE